MLGSDHAPHTREEKEIGWTDMWACNGGAPEIEHCYPMLLDAVNSGKLTLERMVKICCENPAKLLGAFPRKGAIRVGADADFAVCDMNLRQTITEDRIYSKCGWSSYAGNTYTGFPVMTVVRGRVAMRDGEVLAGPGDGKVILRDYANA